MDWYVVIVWVCVVWKAWIWSAQCCVCMWHILYVHYDCVCVKMGNSLRRKPITASDCLTPAKRHDDVMYTYGRPTTFSACISVRAHTHLHVQHAVLAGVHWRKWLCVYKTVFGASSFTISEDDSTGEVKLYRRHFALPRYSRFDLLCFSLFGSHKIYLVIAVISL